ncbi:MAG: SDR family oxidoreductase [Pseudomonadota bacterium]
MNLAGRKALVTGANGGIGQALADALLVAGAGVLATDLSFDHAPPCEVVLGDLTDASFCDGLPKAAEARLGGLDMIFNNAGIMRRGILTDATDDDYAITMAINVEAPMRICRAAIPLMANNGGGAIVNTASCWGVHPGPGHPLYVMSKAAIASLTQCLARDHAHQNIRVNAVCPNEVDTPMLRTGFEIRDLDPQTAIDDLNKSVPIGHIASPREIADAALFLASDQARYVTGALLEVNGGKPVS